MIIEGLMWVIEQVNVGVINNLMPNFDFINNIPTSTINNFINIITGLGYIFPLGDFAVILGIYISFYAVLLGYNILRTVREFLPF